jgi:hypothetical protein
MHAFEIFGSLTFSPPARPACNRHALHLWPQTEQIIKTRTTTLQISYGCFLTSQLSYVLCLVKIKYYRSVQISEQEKNIGNISVISFVMLYIFAFKLYEKFNKENNKSEFRIFCKKSYVKQK